LGSGATSALLIKSGNRFGLKVLASTHAIRTCASARVSASIAAAPACREIRWTKLMDAAHKFVIQARGTLILNFYIRDGKDNTGILSERVLREAQRA
jgi:hypothetical protein